MVFKRLLFGTAGIPLSTPQPSSTAKGVAHVKKLGLDGMELEFVHSVNISDQKAPEVRKAAEENGVALTCHGSYYINLNSAEKEKIDASVQRVLAAAKRAAEAGAYSMTFHSAFYQKDSPQKTFANVKVQLEKITSALSSQGCKISVRPETTGKGTQFGSLDELLQMSQQVDNILPCIDFSHLHARTGGKENTYGEFRATLEKSEKALGKAFLKNMHCHIAGIAYSEKGEKNHLLLKESDFNYLDLLKAMKDFGCAGLVVCESPNIEGDALLLKKTFEEL